MSNRNIVAELRRIAQEHGGELHPADVVNAAKPKTSILHSRFEWDDSEAAQRYRLWQARQLIAITVEYTGAEENPVLSRVFVSLTADRADDGGYRSVQAVLSDPASRSALLQDALQEMRRFQKKFKQLEELAAVFKAMESVKVKPQRSRVKEAVAS